MTERARGAGPPGTGAARRAPGPPGPAESAWFGSMRALSRGTLQFYQGLHRSYGDLVRFHVGPLPAYLLTEPDAIARLLKDDVEGARRGIANQALRPFFGHALFFTEGDAWRERRRLLSPSFSARRLRDLEGVVCERAGELVAELARLPPGTEVDLHSEVRRSMVALACEALLGCRAMARDPGLASDLNEAWLEADRRTNPLGRLNPLRSLRFATVVRRLRRAVRAALVEVRAGRAEPCLLGDLCAPGASGRALSESALRDEALTFVLTAHECTTLVASAALYLSAREPWSGRLAAEVRGVVGRESASFDHLPRLRLLERVVNEAMRLYPPSWMLARQLNRPLEVLGHRLPENGLVLISPYLLHRHPALWERPEVFDPARFERRAPRHAFIPFGMGPRTCIGRSLALRQASMFCALAHRRLELSASAPARWPDSPGLTLRPVSGLRVRVAPRRS